MKNEPLYTYFCAAGISLCLGLGSIGSMVSGLTLSVNPVGLVILCLLLAAIVAGFSCLHHGELILLGLGSLCLLNADFLTQLKTVAAAVATRLLMAYGIPTPEWLLGEYASQLLPALCFWAGLIMIAAAWAVQKQRTAIPAALLSLMPLTCCITVTDTVPGSPWLFLWGLGLVLLLMTQGVRHNSVRQANRLTLALLIPVLLVLLLLFRMIPRNAPDNWTIAQLPQQIFSYFSGNAGPGPELDLPVSSPQVDLSALGKRQQKQTPVMEVSAEFNGTLYLRGRDYDQYNGTSWTSTTKRIEELYGFSEYHQKDGSVEIRVRQTRDYFFLPADTLDVQYITDGQAPNPSKERTYRFERCSLRSDWKANWTDSQISTVNPRYLRLSDETLQCALAYLRTHVPEETLLSDCAPDIAERIGQLLRQHVPYDLSTPNMPAEETDLAIWFLNDAQSGYCVHFATAAVVLLRAYGIPARYVEGYAVPVYAGETVTVREKSAHAWAEYYVNGVGWLVLEATPGSTAPVEPSETQPAETQPAETQPATAPTTVPTTDPTQTEPPTGPSHRTTPPWIKTLLRVLLWSLAAPAILWAQYRLRRKLLHQSLRRGKPNRRALVLYRQLCRLARWTGTAVPPELTQLAQKARFSNHTLTKPELSLLQRHLKLSEAALSKLPPAKRLFAKWLFARY